MLFKARSVDARGMAIEKCIMTGPTMRRERRLAGGQFVGLSAVRAYDVKYVFHDFAISVRENFASCWGGRSWHPPVSPAQRPSVVLTIYAHSRIFATVKIQGCRG